MNAEQVTALTDALAGLNTRHNARKPNTFSTGEPTDWTTWKASFLLCVGLNNWNDNRAKQEAKACFLNPAALYVVDLDPTAAGRTLAQYLALMEERFLPAAQTDMVRVSFRSACQGENETVLAWHSRCRTLFVRAFPDDALDTSAHVIDQFVLGLVQPEVKAKVWESRPPTFTAALTTANNKTAAMAILAATCLTGARGGKREMNAINSFGNRTGGQAGQAAASGTTAVSTPGSRPCWFCKTPGHFKKDCNKYKAAVAKGTAGPGTGNRYNGAGRGAGAGAGGGRAKGASGNSGRPGIHAVDNGNEDGEEVDERWEEDDEGQGNF